MCWTNVVSIDSKWRASVELFDYLMWMCRNHLFISHLANKQRSILNQTIHNSFSLSLCFSHSFNIHKPNHLCYGITHLFKYLDAIFPWPHFLFAHNCQFIPFDYILSLVCINHVLRLQRFRFPNQHHYFHNNIIAHWLDILPSLSLLSTKTFDQTRYTAHEIPS